MKGPMGEITLSGANLVLVVWYGAVISYAGETCRRCDVEFRMVDLWHGHVRLAFRRGAAAKNLTIHLQELRGESAHLIWRQRVDNAIDEVFAASVEKP